MPSRRHIIAPWLLLAPLCGIASATPAAQALPRFEGANVFIEVPGKKPRITGFGPGSCVRKGRAFTVLGQHFGAPRGKEVALIGRGAIHLTLEVKAWTDTKITVFAPKDPRLLQHNSYTVGIEKAGRGGALSNFDKKMTICRELRVSADTRRSPDDETPPPPTDDGVEVEPPSEDGPFLPLPGGRPARDMALPPAPEAPPTQREDPQQLEAGQVVALSGDMQAAVALERSVRRSGFTPMSRRRLGNLGLVLSVFRTPQGLTVSEAVRRLREELPGGWFDANLRYQLMAASSGKRYAQRLIGWHPSLRECASKFRIGLVDTAVDLTHPALQGLSIKRQSTLSPGVEPARKTHGTAIAALLIGAGDSDFPGLLPDAQLYVAEVFRQRENAKVDTTTESIVRALDWLLGQRVTAINLSFGSAYNQVLDLAVRRVLDTGVQVIAAGGNNGSNAPPVYPAAQEGVIAVTAVDAELEPYSRANQGEYIDFAAPGVDVWTAKPGGGGSYVTGTSFATPFVVAAIATRRDPRMPADKLTSKIGKPGKHVKDLGIPGKDPVFGWGLLLATPGCKSLAQGS